MKPHVLPGVTSTDQEGLTIRSTSSVWSTLKNFCMSCSKIVLSG